MITNPIEEIKNRLDIVEVIGGYLKLTKAGANYRAVCPFHSEKKPSFFVSPSRQIWKCFGCSKGGDIFGFIKEIEGVEFGDALRLLASRAGVELKRMGPEFKELKTQRQRLYEVCELATRFFQAQLEESKTGQKVKEYLLERGIDQASQKLWRLGYSPMASSRDWRVLSDFLVGKGYQREEVEKAGLAIKDEKGNFYDRFRGRIIFPIFDLNSQTVGFGGRVFGAAADKEIAKYVNTPNTLLYDKSRILYGLNQAKVAIRKQNACVLVEGYVDVILSHQNNINNVAATSGTALTPFQLNLLKRYSENLILAFDPDFAGNSATKRGIDLAQQKGFNIKIAILPEGKDPADTILADLADWQNALTGTKDILDFYFETTLGHFNPEMPGDKKEIAKILLPVLKRIPNQIVQSYWVQKLAQALFVKEEDIKEELDKVRLDEPWPAPREREAEPIQPEKKSQEEMLEQRLIALTIKSSKPIEIKQETAEFISKPIRDLLLLLGQGKKDLEKLKQEVSKELWEKLQFLFLEAEVALAELKPEEVESEFAVCVERLKELKIKKQLRILSLAIRQAEAKNEEARIKALTEEFNHLTKKLNV